MQTPYLVILPALIKTVHFSNVCYIRLIPNLSELREDDLIKDLWWTPYERAVFRKEAAVEASKEYFKLSFEEKRMIRFERFAKYYWTNYDPLEPFRITDLTADDVSGNVIIFI